MYRPNSLCMPLCKPTTRQLLKATLLGMCMVLGIGIVPAQAQSAPCGLPNAAFCDTFDAPAGIGNRSGQLNGTVWGESHTTGDQNYGGPAFGWATSHQQVCGATQDVTPDHDAYICNGQLVEGQDDQGVDALTLYPKQPFDFAGRTGKIVFDVSNDSGGSHAAWPELWVTDQPVPSPFAHEDSLKSLPRNGFGIRFAGFVDANGSGASCPEGSPAYVGVDSAITISNYVENDSFNGGNLSIQGDDCVKESNGTGSQMNHYEIDVSQAKIDIYGTDAGATAPLKHLATISNANLNFTRGVMWIEDAHYAACKFSNQCIHTFTWDNVGFDGPVLPRDLSYDILDHLVPNGGTSDAGLPVLDLGWTIGPGGTQSFTLNNMADPATANGSLLLFSFWSESAPTNFDYTINGHQHSFAWPYPDSQTFTPRTIAIPLVLSDLKAGTNTFSIAPSTPLNIANVNIVLLGAGAGGGTPTNTPVPSATATNTPIPSATVTSTPTLTPTPANLCYVLTSGDGGVTSTWTVQSDTKACQGQL